MKRTHYRYLWYEKDDKPLTDFEKGITLFLTILSFPAWIIPYIVYKIFSLIGTGLKQKRYERDEEEKETYY